MSSAKFFLMGEVSHWVRVRVGEEIHSHGLEGNVVNAGAETLAVIVEGDKGKIQKFYKDLKHSVPHGIAFTEIHYRKPMREMTASEIPREEMNEKIISLLTEIERGVRRVNQRLDAALEGKTSGLAGSAAESESSASIESGDSTSSIGGGGESDSSGWGWTESDDSGDKEDTSESADSVSSFFDNMP